MKEWALAAVVLATLVASGCGGENSQESNVNQNEQAVIVHLDPSNLPDDWGVDLVEDPLIDAIDQAGVGEFDGNEIALDGSEVVLYAYGPDADALWGVMEPIIMAVPPGPASYAIKRYGPAEDRSAREIRIDL